MPEELKEHTPLVKYNFKLVVEFVTTIPISRVDSFDREMEFELIQEGGVNDYVHMLRKQITKPYTLVVHKPAGINNFLDSLEAGTVLIAPMLLIVGREAGNFDIMPGMGRMAKRVYAFTGCQVMRKTFGELDAETSGIIEEEVEIGYREFYYIDFPGV